MISPHYRYDITYVTENKNIKIYQGTPRSFRESLSSIIVNQKYLEFEKMERV